MRVLARRGAQRPQLVPVWRTGPAATGRGRAAAPAVPGFEPPPALGERQAAQILLALAQHVVEPHRRRVVAQHFRVRRLAVEPLLQIVERRDLAVADHQQLAVQRHGIRQRREHVRKGARRYRRRSANRAASRRRARRAARGCRPISIRRDSRADRAGRDRPPRAAAPASAGRRSAASPVSGGSGTAFEPSEQGRVGRREAVPDLLDPGDLDAAPLGEREFGEARRHADPQAAGDELQQCPAAGRIEPSSQRARCSPTSARLHSAASRRSR